MSQLDQVASVPRSPACPRCTMPMLLSRLEPHPREHATIDCVTYQCLCGELLTRPQTRR